MSASPAGGPQWLRRLRTWGPTRCSNGFGLKIGLVTRKGFEARVRKLVTGQATLEHITRAMLAARAVLRVEYEKLHKSVLAMVRVKMRSVAGL